MKKGLTDAERAAAMDYEVAETSSPCIGSLDLPVFTGVFHSLD
jgi:hypothetical protein